MENILETKKDIDSILWGKADNDSKDPENHSNNEEVMENNIIDNNSKDPIDDSNNDNNSNNESDQSSLNVVTNKKKRNVMKFGNKDWVNQIPEEEKLIPGETIIHIDKYGFNKFGIFKAYGKKETSIIVEMFKVGKSELMSREWSLRLPDITIVKHTKDSEITSGYIEKDGVFYTKSQFEQINQLKQSKQNKQQKNKQTANNIQNEINQMPEAN